LIWHAAVVVVVGIIWIAVGSSVAEPDNKATSVSPLAYAANQDFDRPFINDFAWRREVGCATSCRIRSLFFPFLRPASPSLFESPNRQIVLTGKTT
jgi:hypothetical protein